jgi:ribosome biogenesis SPOUT family RNA methylase Rps3
MSRQEALKKYTAASKDLSPEDGDTFDIFLFGGILGG